MCKGGSQKTTQTYTPDPTVGQAGTQALTMAQQAAGLPFQQQVAPVADLPSDYLSAFANMREANGMAQPYINRGAQLMDQSAQPISAGQVGNYLNPFANFIMGNLKDVFGQQMKQTTSGLTQAAGGVGADRIGVAQANLAKQQGLAAGQTLANIYQPALAAAQQDAARQQSAGFGFGQLGPTAQAAAQSGAQGLASIGEIQRQQQQAQLNAPYQWDLARIAHNYQIPQWLSGVTSQTAPSLGRTTTNEYPKQSPWGTIAGLGMTALGAFTGNPMMVGSGLMGTMSGLGSGGMGGASQGPMGFGGYQPGMNAGYGATWMPAPNGPGSMAPMYFSRGGAVDLEDIGGSYADGGETPFPGGIFGGLGGDPQSDWTPSPDAQDRIRAAGAELPPPPYATPGGIEGAFSDAMPPFQGYQDTPQPPPPNLPPEITGPQQAGLPPDAMGYAAPPQGGPPTLPPPAMPPQPPQGAIPALPPDPGEGSFARSPGAALMAAGLATMAAAGKRDSRGLPTPPLAAIGEGGLHGVEALKAQDTAATQRRRVDLEARRLLIQAEAARREAELHPLKMKHMSLENRKADLALSALTAGEDVIKDPAKLRELGITPAQAAILGPIGVRAVVQDLVKGKYDIKEINGEMWAVDRVDPRRSIKIGGGRGLSAYGIPDEGGANGAPAAGGVLGTQPPRGPRPSGVAPPPEVAPPVSPSAAVGAQPAGRSSSPKVVGSANEAFGPGSVLNWLNLKVQGTATNTASRNVTEQARAAARINILRDRLISALASGQPGERLKMVQERVQGIFPKPGQFFTPAPEARASFVEFHAELNDRIKENETIINSPGYSKQTKDKAAQSLLEQRRVRDQLTSILQNMAQSESGGERNQRRPVRPTNPEVGKVYPTPTGNRPYLGNGQWGPPQ